MTDIFCGKRLLILGGSYLHNKVVEAANEMGIYTIVIDNIPDSPAKKLASKSYDINVSDVDSIVNMCKRERVDGVLTVMLDFCQIYYQQICEKLGLPCYGTEKQFKLFTNKELFKQLCIDVGVDIIPTYSRSEIHDKTIYPVIVKPAHNRGSRGQSVCYSETEIDQAIILAEQSSEDKNVIIEKYMGGKEDFQVTYLVINKNVYVVRTADRYLGSKELGMDRVAIALSSPSRNTDLYMNTIHPKMIKLIKHAGIENGPVFIQGFVDGETIRFYDPGLRFPGGDYDRLFSEVIGINLMKLLVEFSLTGKINDVFDLDTQTVYLKGNIIFTLHPIMKNGIIKSITNIEALTSIPGVKFVTFRHFVGDKIEYSGTVNQRVAEFNILAKTQKELKNTIENISRVFSVKDENENEMLINMFDPDCLRLYRGGLQ